MRPARARLCAEHPAEPLPFRCRVGKCFFKRGRKSRHFTSRVEFMRHRRYGSPCVMDGLVGEICAVPKNKCHSLPGLVADMYQSQPI